MSDIVMKRFEFAASVTKAYTKEKDGVKKYYVEAIASDTGIDYYMERMSDKAINQMVDQCKNGIIILPTHWDTFDIGKTVDAEAIQSPFNSELLALSVTIELDTRYPQAVSLFEDVEKGACEKQLSIGGWLNSDNDESAYWEELEVEISLPNGSKTNRTYWILVLDDLILDHIATTRAKQAANERTGFTSAIAKSLRAEFNEKFEVVKSNNDSALMGLKRIKAAGSFELKQPVEKRGGDLMIEDNKEIVGVFRKGLLDIFKSVFSPFEDNSKEEIEKGATEDMENEKTTVEITEEVVKSQEEENTKETETTETPKEETVEKTTEENQEKQTQQIDIESLKSVITADLLKSVGEQLNGSVLKSISDTVSATVTQTIEDVIKSQIEPLAAKIKSIEDSAAGSKSIEGQDDIESVTKSTEESGSVWSGTFLNQSIVKSVQAAKAKVNTDKEE